MTGIQFLTDEKSRKVAVQIDLRKHRAQSEDFYDSLVSEHRRKEQGVPFESVEADLINLWRIRLRDYRIVYIIDEDRKRVSVTRAAHRREIYE